MNNNKKNKIMFLNIETTGLPLKNNLTGDYYMYTESQKYDCSRIIRLTWIIMESFDLNSNQIMRDYIIKPDNFELNGMEYHGISLTEANNGNSFGAVANIFKKDLSSCFMLVGHNLMFIISVLCSELYRKKFIKTIELLKIIKKICVSEVSAELLKIPLNKTHPTIKFKKPSLEELSKWCKIHDDNNKINLKKDSIQKLITVAKCYFYIVDYRNNLNNKKTIQIIKKATDKPKSPK